MAPNLKQKMRKIWNYKTKIDNFETLKFIKTFWCWVQSWKDIKWMVHKIELRFEVELIRFMVRVGSRVMHIYSMKRARKQILLRQKGLTHCRRVGFEMYYI